MLEALIATVLLGYLLSQAWLVGEVAAGVMSYRRSMVWWVALSAIAVTVVALLIQAV